MIVVGNSAGAYAAILIGTLLDADVIHAFAPYSNLSDKRYLRNQATIEHVHRTFSSRYFDLRPTLEKRERAGAIHLYYDPDLTIDSWQATHLSGVPNVYHHPLPGRSHELIYLLRDSGELRKILSASVEGSSHAVDTSVVPLWQTKTKKPRRLARLKRMILAALGFG